MAGALDRAFVEVTAELNTRQVQRAAQTAGKNIADGLTKGVRDAERSIGRQSEQLGETIAEGVGDGIENGFKRDVNGRLRDQFGRFVNDGGRGGRSTGTAFGDGFSEGLSDALSSITGIRLPTPAFAVLGAAMAAAAGAAVQLASALAPAVGIIAALPSGIGVLSAGMTTLSVAALGVGDAFEAAATGSAEEFSEAIEGLAPSVQSAAQAIRDMTPALEELRNSVQDAFFQNFDDILNSLAETLLGPVTQGMTSVASAMNGVITGLAQVATSQAGVDFVTSSFEIMAQAIETVQDPLALLFESLLNVGNAINEAFGDEAGAGIADLITRLAEFLNQAAEGGAAVAWVTHALDTFQQIGDILSPLVGIFQSIGRAAALTGGNILGAFGEALQVFDDFLASAAGQDVLISIFQALNTVGEAFATVLANIAPAIPPIIDGIGSILSVVAPLLGPLSELVGSVLAALAPILGVIAAAIQPLIGPLSTIIESLGVFLIEAITSLMPTIELLAGFISDVLLVALQILSPILEALGPIFQLLSVFIAPLLPLLEPIVTVLTILAEIIGAVLTPVFEVLGAIITWLVENVIQPYFVPAIELIADLLSGLLVEAIEYLVQQFQAAGEGLSIIFNFIKEQISNRVDEMVTTFETLALAFQLGWALINQRVFTPLKNGIAAVRDTVSSALSNIRSGWDSFVGFIQGIPGRIKGALSSLFSPIASGFRSAINDVIAAWNNLSFSIPSVNIPGLGTVGGGTINTPNIPFLARGAVATGPTLAMVGEGSGPEAIMPLEDPRVTSLLATALSRAGIVAQNGAGTSSDGITATATNGDTFFLVKIGEREITDIVVEQQNIMNQSQLRRARAGTGRRG